MSIQSYPCDIREKFKSLTEENFDVENVLQHTLEQRWKSLAEIFESSEEPGWHEGMLENFKRKLVQIVDQNRIIGILTYLQKKTLNSTDYKDLLRKTDKFMSDIQYQEIPRTIRMSSYIDFLIQFSSYTRKWLILSKFIMNNGDLLFEILQQCSPSQLARCREVCRTWRSICDEDPSLREKITLGRIAKEAEASEKDFNDWK